MIFMMTAEQHAQIVDALESVYGKGKRCEAALAMLKAMQPQTPCAWAMFRDGHFYDAIQPKERTRHEGEYVYPLYTPEQSK